jgi:DivIVA domain-containing protein
VVTVLALLGVALVLFAAAVVATRDGGGLADAPQDLPDLALPDGPLRADDVERVRFSMAPRGYRMSEVDAVLDRLAAELADRDRRLAQLGSPVVPDERPAADGGSAQPVTTVGGSAQPVTTAGGLPSGGDRPG